MISKVYKVRNFNYFGKSTEKWPNKCPENGHSDRKVTEKIEKVTKIDYT